MLACLFQTEVVDRLLLEKFVTAKLEGTLHKIASKGWTEAGCKGANTFTLDDLAETTDHTTVIGGRFELYPRLDTT